MLPMRIVLNAPSSTMSYFAIYPSFTRISAIAIFILDAGIGEFIGRSAADTENGCDVIYGVCSALGRPFFVGAHKMILPANSILKWPLKALCDKGFLLIPC